MARAVPPHVEDRCLQIFGEGGELECEETFADPLSGDPDADLPGRLRLVKPG
jgi:hypothetical protein